MQLTKRVTEEFFIPNDPDGASITLKHLKINEVKAIEAKANSMSFSADENGEGTTRIDFDPYTRSRMMAHAAIIGWGGFKDTLGRDLKFSRANVDKAGEFVVTIDIDKKKVDFDFYGWVERCRAELAKTVSDEEEVSSEN